MNLIAVVFTVIMRFYSIVYSLGLKTLNFLGDDLEEESSNEDQITEMIKEIGKYNNMTHFSFFTLTSVESNRILLTMILYSTLCV